MTDESDFQLDLRTVAPDGSTAPLEGGLPKPLTAAGRGIGAGAAEGALAATRFPPGCVIGGRYRMLALLGRGGMGEVWRAEDLVLGETVALKFLPRGAGLSPGLQTRMLAEARVARRLTHAHLCRVHDVGLVDGEPFISMECVEGGTLAALFAAGGPSDPQRAVEIATELCLGLAAAHERGVLHRDLKPQNVMFDALGRVRIMDFGLAAVAGEVFGAELLSGTARYMAPEQREGREVSTRSDLYALGLILAELFTGRFPESDYESNAPDGVAFKLPEGMDPKLERVLTACLRNDPRRRAASAFAIAAGLPGGDPLGASIRAGELPSPALVAAAGGDAAFGAKATLLLAALAVLGSLLGAIYTEVRNPFYGDGAFPRPMGELRAAAESAARAAGVFEPTDHATEGTQVDQLLIRDLRAKASGAERWAPLSTIDPPPFVYWHRRGPRPAVSYDDRWTATFFSPPLGDGEVVIRLWSDGRLESLSARPNRIRVTTTSASQPVRWADLFLAAGLDFDRFAPATPSPSAPVFVDRFMAWEGPRHDGAKVRVEAATRAGVCAWFAVLRPGAATSLGSIDYQASMIREQRIEELFALMLLPVFILFAVRNVRGGSAFLKGAWRFGAFLASARALNWLCGADAPLGGVEPLWSAGLGLGQALFTGAFAAAAYLAVEPFVRRRWPELLVSTTRLFDGRWRDPLVGCDMLVGLAASAGMSALLWAGAGAEALGADFSQPLRTPIVYLGAFGLREGAAVLFHSAAFGPSTAFVYLGALTAVFALARNRRIALVVVFAAATVLLARYWQIEDLAIRYAFSAAFAALAVATLRRGGFLAVAAFSFVTTNYAVVPPIADVTAWYAPVGVPAAVATFALVGWSAFVALRGGSAQK